MKRINIVTLFFALFIPLAVGGISAALSAKGMASYGSMNKPPLSPPAWVFSVAWTILYLMMGLASYFILIANTKLSQKTTAIIIFGIQLAMNFFWSIIFFNKGDYLLAFIWLIVMLCVVVICTYKFFGISRISAFLLIPYIVWLIFAAYLNMGAYILRVV